VNTPIAIDQLSHAKVHALGYDACRFILGQPVLSHEELASLLVAILHCGINAAGAENVGRIFRKGLQIVRFRKSEVKRGEQRSIESVR
jgi:hypothetical protein